MNLKSTNLASMIQTLIQIYFYTQLFTTHIPLEYKIYSLTHPLFLFIPYQLRFRKTSSEMPYQSLNLNH